MSQFKVYPYNMTSKSARVLSRALNALRVYPDRGYRPKANHIIINWGGSTRPNWMNDPMAVYFFINRNDAVANAAHKLKTFQKFQEYDVPCPEWTLDTEVAQAWVDQDHKVYGRKLLTSHSGNGIRIFENETITTPDRCPLYTKATKASAEYRIHVGNSGDTIIDMTQKKKRNGHEGGIRGIRNHSNGWIYARDGVVVPDAVVSAAMAAVDALNLDFGAADVGYNERENRAYVYEVNTAPGLVGTTLTNYVNYFKGIQNEMRGL